uniref:Uncharacterized protein n=1 Tax=Leersia perrieri TaxID=77586 RepID=A0A0D9W7J1_9ORYZ
MAQLINKEKNLQKVPEQSKWMELGVLPACVAFELDISQGRMHPTRRGTRDDVEYKDPPKLQLNKANSPGICTRTDRGLT